MIKWLAAIWGILKSIVFFVDMYNEKDNKEAEKKMLVAREIIDAFAETDKSERASKLNAALSHIDQL